MMDSIGTLAGLLSIAYKQSDNILTILLDPRTGNLMSFLVDDGTEIQEFYFSEKKSSIEYGTDPLQWGLFA